MGLLKQYKIDIVILFFCLGASFFLFGETISTDSFGYDEADLMYAASKGLYANYIDNNAIPFSNYVRLGLSKGFKREEKTSLSKFIRDSGDITFYRHYHGPLYIYFLSFTHGLFGENEFLIRWSSLLFWVVSVAVTYMGCIFLIGKEGRRSAVLASAFLFFSSINIQTCAQITPHGLYTLIAVLCLFFIAKFLKTEQLRYYYFASLALALAFLTVEYALLLLLTFISCVWLYRKKGFFGLSSRDHWVRGIFIPAGLFVGTIFVLWPAAWLKMGLVKNYIHHTFYALIRGDEYGVQTFWQVWLNRFLNSPIEYLLIAFATGIALFKLKSYKFYLPFLIYPFLMFVTTLRNTSTSPTYVSSLLPPLYILSGIIISDILGKLPRGKRTFLVTLIVLGLFSSFCVQHYYRDFSKEKPIQNLGNIIQYVEKNELYNGKILVDRDIIPTLHYYFPDKRLPSYRKDESFDTIMTKLRVNSYAGIIFAANGDRISFEKQLQRHFAFNANIIGVYDNREIIHYMLKSIK